MARKSKPRVNESTVDLWWLLLFFQPTVCRKSVSQADLRERRNELETITEPHFSKTPGKFLFKESRRSLKGLKSDYERTHIATAIVALQCLYKLEAAWNAGDIDAAVRWAVRFGRHEQRLKMDDWWGAR